MVKVCSRCDKAFKTNLFLSEYQILNSSLEEHMSSYAMPAQVNSELNMCPECIKEREDARNKADQMLNGNSIRRKAI